MGATNSPDTAEMRRRYALERALEMHGGSSISMKPATAETLVSAAKTIEAYVKGGDDKTT